MDDASDSQVSTSDSQQTVDTSSALVDFNDHSCPVWRSKQIGFAVDTNIWLPESAVPFGSWAITAVDNNGQLQLKQTVSFNDIFQEQTKDLETLVQEGRKVAQKV